MASTAGGSSSDAPAVCPVDHKTRDAWIAQARAQQQQQQQTAAIPSAVAPPRQQQSAGPWYSRWLFADSSAAAPAQQPSQPPPHQHHPSLSSSPADGLETDRVVSSIPRTSTPTAAASDANASTAAAAAAPACPVNHEVETGADPVSGNWIYPSEKMFFEAMKRKGHDNARVADMKVVVPIHNAVNERAWQDIRAWEAPYTGTAPGQCATGPRLHSFAGLGGGDSATRMSPRARLYTLLGYTAPFDRHDWVVDRCGQQIEYVIDFYAGRPGAPQKQQAQKNAPQMPLLSFYLDVRPKLNSWEGVKMRALRFLGVQ